MNLAQNAPVEVFDLAAKWANRLNLMHQEFGIDNILLPIRMPDQAAHEIFDTAQEALSKLQTVANLFTVTNDEDEKNAIRRFALGN